MDEMIVSYNKTSAEIDYYLALADKIIPTRSEHNTFLKQRGIDLLKLKELRVVFWKNYDKGNGTTLAAIKEIRDRYLRVLLRYVLFNVTALIVTIDCLSWPLKYNKINSFLNLVNGIFKSGAIDYSKWKQNVETLERSVTDEIKNLKNTFRHTDLDKTRDRISQFNVEVGSIIALPQLTPIFIAAVFFLLFFLLVVQGVTIRIAEFIHLEITQGLFPAMYLVAFFLFLLPWICRFYSGLRHLPTIGDLLKPE